MEYINEYIETLYIIEDLEYLGEADLKAIIRKITPQYKLKNIGSKLRRVSYDKPDEVFNTVKRLGLPPLEPSKADKKLTEEIGSEYKKFNKKAEMVLKNSLSKVDKKLIDAAATIVTLKSFLKMKGESDNLDVRFRENLKKFVSDSHYYEREQEEEKEEVPPGTGLDLAIAIAIISTAIAAFLAWLIGVVIMFKIGFAMLPIAILLGVIVFAATKALA